MVQQGGLDLAFEVTCARATGPRGITFRAVFSNASDAPVRLFTMLLEHLSLYMQTRRAEDKRPVSPSWVPFPPIDDGSGRRDLAPGEKAVFEYRGSDCFQSLDVGKYEARFRYECAVEKSGEWKGVLETPWVPFEIVPQGK